MVIKSSRKFYIVNFDSRQLWDIMGVDEDAKSMGFNYRVSN